MDITPGLIDENGELFVKNGMCYASIGGRCVTYAEFPTILIEVIDASMTQEDHNCLDELDIFDIHLRRKKWIKCNVSRFDSDPDYIAGQPTLKREFTECSNRGKCNCEKRLCRTLEQLSGFTTKQILYMSYTHQGLLDKEIAHEMGISVETAKSHSQNIRIKTGLARKADLVRLAQKLNLITQQ